MSAGVDNKLKISILAAVLLGAPAAFAAETYVPGPDSRPQPGVPKGEVLSFTFAASTIFSGTERDYWVYVPAQYRPDQPACVYVHQDGVRYEAPIVFDNLIHKKEMPVTIGVFVAPGRVPALDAERALDRFERSLEYDTPGDAYVRFLLEELLPDVEKQKASDGRPLRLSKSGHDRAIGGASSGAIAAFTAAWERPGEFTRVFSAIGTYVGLRGGDRYPTLVRKMEPKPIRVFLQDGSNDNNRAGGDWWMANQTMQRALEFAGYDVRHAWGDGGHDGKHATAVFPEAMRWLWRDWPQGIKAGTSQNHMLAEILIPGEDWQLVGEGYRFVEGPAVNAGGEVFFNDIPNAKTYKVGLDGVVSVYLEDSQKANGQAFGPDGRLYAVTASKVLAYDAERTAATLAEGFAGNDIVVAHNGNVYVTHPPDNQNPAAPSQVWLIRPNGEKVSVDSGLRYANGIALSPDQSLLYVSDHRSRWVYGYQVQPDGTLKHKQRYFALHVQETADDSSADGMHVDRDGRLYVASRGGWLQICDAAGRVNAILPTPNRRISNVTLGGPSFDTLFVTAGDRVYKRKVKVRGANAWQPPFKPGAPRL